MCLGKNEKKRSLLTKLTFKNSSFDFGSILYEHCNCSHNAKYALNQRKPSLQERGFVYG